MASGAWNKLVSWRSPLTEKKRLFHTSQQHHELAQILFLIVSVAFNEVGDETEKSPK